MGERKLRGILNNLKKDTSEFTTNTVALAKEEIGGEVKKVGVGAGLIVAALCVIPIVLVLLSIALGYGLVALGVWPWLAFIIDAVIFVLVAALLAWIAIKRFKSIKPPVKTAAAISGTAKAVGSAFKKKPQDSSVLQNDDLSVPRNDDLE